MRQTVLGWHLQLMNDKELSDVSNMFALVIREWANYYGRFHSSADTIVAARERRVQPRLTVGQRPRLNAIKLLPAATAIYCLPSCM